MKIVQKLLFTVDTSDLWGAAIDALSGPRSTQGVFKEERLHTEITPEDKERFPGGWTFRLSVLKLWIRPVLIQVNYLVL